MQDCITFEYPFPEIDYEFPENSRMVRHKASMLPVQIDHEPYELILKNEKNLLFHLIFGKMSTGENYLCIPFWDFGCEIADFRNKLYNYDSIVSDDKKFNLEDATAITYALAKAADVIAP